MPDRTIPYATDRNALYHPHLGKSIFPVNPLSDELLAAEAARLAYKQFEKSPAEKAEVEAAWRSVGFDPPVFWNREGSQAFAAASPARRLAVLAFRGTEGDDPSDLAADADTIWSPWKPGGRVHQGFAHYLELLWPDVAAWLATWPGQLILTGHSLGAALATLAASRLADRRDTLELITFGSPRVGDEELTRTLAGIRISRFVDCCDLVTQMPPEVMGFRHVASATLCYIDRLGQVHRQPSDELLEDDAHKARADYLLSYAWKIGHVAVRELADHAPINYVEALRSR